MKTTFTLTVADVETVLSAYFHEKFNPPEPPKVRVNLPFVETPKHKRSSNNFTIEVEMES